MMTASGPSRHLLRLHKGGRCRGEADITDDFPVATTCAWLKFDGRTRHPLSMENGGQTKVLFCCAKCGAAYQAIQRRSPVRATGSFKCQVCRETLHSWAGRYDYFDWKAIEP
jgi:hypothetical protein